MTTMEAKFKHLERVGEKMKIKSEKALFRTSVLTAKKKKKKKKKSVLEIRKTQYKQQNPEEQNQWRKIILEISFSLKPSQTKPKVILFFFLSLFFSLTHPKHLSSSELYHFSDLSVCLFIYIYYYYYYMW